MPLGVDGAESLGQVCDGVVFGCGEAGVAVEDFLGVAAGVVQEAVEAARKAGIPLIAAVSTEDEFRAAAVAAAQGTPVLVENCGAPSGMYEEWYANEPAAPGLAFNPGAFAEEGENPFLKVFYRGLLRKKLRHFYVDDRTSDGTPALPGRGNGEVKEILSMLRCRSYGGVVTLRAPQAGPEAFRETAAAFWKLLDEM